MAVVATRVTVEDASPVALNVAGTAGADLIVRPVGAAVDIGGPAVASGEGLEVADGEAVAVHLDAGDVLYAIAASEVLATVQVLSS